MNYLLDTHVYLWLLGAPEELSREAREAIQDPRHSVFVSAVSAAEIAIKKSLGKLDAPTGLGVEISLRGLNELAFSFHHGECMESLPRHHADPFDRMLLAQAISEKFTLVTRDRKLAAYAVSLLWT
jgi:PIN domain nuclease of toxin-antitoxin system